jgi:hypothetical protein
MSDITHSDWCPVGNTGELEDCAPCLQEQERAHAYYGALYAREHHYTREEIEDAYSDSTDYAKREAMLRTFETR